VAKVCPSPAVCLEFRAADRARRRPGRSGKHGLRVRPRWGRVKKKNTSSCEALAPPPLNVVFMHTRGTSYRQAVPGLSRGACVAAREMLGAPSTELRRTSFLSLRGRSLPTQRSASITEFPSGGNDEAVRGGTNRKPPNVARSSRGVRRLVRRTPGAARGGASGKVDGTEKCMQM
jgi:hypothetical protein